ncbi:MAG: DUF4358 domain-containing protein [Clostridia bacterium]|nr:DUF4358 domain-containing protein [Clostridia bacterium]
MKKTLVSITAVIIALVCMLSACGEKPNNADVTAAELWEKVKAVSGYGAMTAVPERDYMDVYGVDKTKLSDSVWYMSENPALNADECAIFKLADASYADDLAKILKDRLSRQLAVAKAYSPEEAGKIEKAEVTVSGSFVYFCVGENSDAMMNAIRNAVK